MAVELFTKKTGTGYEYSISTSWASNVIVSSLIEKYGINGYKSIMQTLVRESAKTEEEIIGDYDLFTKTVLNVFGNIGNSKILEPLDIIRNTV
jgi:hypothetical protein